AQPVALRGEEVVGVEEVVAVFLGNGVAFLRGLRQLELERHAALLADVRENRVPVLSRQRDAALVQHVEGVGLLFLRLRDGARQQGHGGHHQRGTPKCASNHHHLSHLTKPLLSKTASRRSARAGRPLPATCPRWSCPGAPCCRCRARLPWESVPGRKRSAASDRTAGRRTGTGSGGTRLRARTATRTWRAPRLCPAGAASGT